MPYKYLEDIATADIAFRAWGRSLEQTFQSAADAVMNVMIEDLDSIRPRKERALRLREEALDMLLFNFLQELIYYKDSERLLLRVKHLEVQPGADASVLSATLHGEPLDPAWHPQRVDVKAVTLHRFSLAPISDGWEATVILDI